MTMSKPNQSQLDIAKKMLKKEDTKFCGGCLKEDDTVITRKLFNGYNVILAYCGCIFHVQF